MKEHVNTDPIILFKELDPHIVHLLEILMLRKVKN